LKLAVAVLLCFGSVFKVGGTFFTNDRILSERNEDVRTNSITNDLTHSISENKVRNRRGYARLHGAPRINWINHDATIFISPEPSLTPIFSSNITTSSNSAQFISVEEIPALVNKMKCLIWVSDNVATDLKFHVTAILEDAITKKGLRVTTNSKGAFVTNAPGFTMNNHFIMSENLDGQKKLLTGGSIQGGKLNPRKMLLDYYFSVRRQMNKNDFPIAINEIWVPINLRKPQKFSSFAFFHLITHLSFGRNAKLPANIINNLHFNNRLIGSFVLRKIIIMTPDKKHFTFSADDLSNLTGFMKDYGMHLRYCKLELAVYRRLTELVI